MQLVRWHRGSSRQIELYPPDILSILVPLIDETTRQQVAGQWMRATTGVEGSSTAVQDALALIDGRFGVRLQASPRDTASATTWTRSLSDVRRDQRIDGEFSTPDVTALREKLQSVDAVAVLDLATSIRRGVQPQSYDDDGDVIVMKSKSVRYPHIDWGSCARAFDEGWEPKLRAGQLLINSTGEGTLGRSGVVPTLQMPAVASVDVYVLDVDNSVALAGYVALFLNSPAGRRLSDALKTGSSGQQHLYPTHFRDLLIPIPLTERGGPDLSWQYNVVNLAVARHDAATAAGETAIRLDRLFASIINYAVDTSLVPI